MLSFKNSQRNNSDVNSSSSSSIGSVTVDTLNVIMNVQKTAIQMMYNRGYDKVDKKTAIWSIGPNNTINYMIRSSSSSGNVLNKDESVVNVVSDSFYDVVSTSNAKIIEGFYFEAIKYVKDHDNASAAAAAAAASETPQHNGLLVEDICILFFSSDVKLGVQEFRQYLELLKAESVQHCIIVCSQGATSFAMTEISGAGCSVEVEIFSHENLQRDILQHKLYRNHRMLSENEKTEKMKEFKSTEKELSLLPRKDPVCRYFNFPVGALIEITRQVGSSAPYKYYRLVV